MSILLCPFLSVFCYIIVFASVRFIEISFFFTCQRQDRESHHLINKKNVLFLEKRFSFHICIYCSTHLDNYVIHISYFETCSYNAIWNNAIRLRRNCIKKSIQYLHLIYIYNSIINIYIYLYKFFVHVGADNFANSLIK